ncbi:3-hydroxyacyl-CoA dehydrogenase [Haloarcula vallismortis]|uniref:3-hydroxyacyl-CoA dehydrogenase n=2 Tax=Haloarcula vallismortis TaxID=28442 RepID=M0J813_HALVA|nr:3-hydroxyacyl-CoA dehydrogenase family protein [Haloarcula vallismortis]EMA05101.1 3-hydroxyacyl-CoA dehydrogenase [Haloarcula vallismortis ATCC 29715]SDX13532.1 3-hydroxyacyl-CoA dehydrogenase [Haloarcula vallismortis]
MHVAILGAGTMGHGIAQVSAMAGHDVSLRDIEADIVDDGLAAIESNLQEGIAREKVSESTAEATLNRLTGTTSLEEAVTGADLVLEAVPEDMEIKHETLTEVESHVDPATLIASNTSSLSLTEIASALDYPERAIGLHFFNPVHIMALVEIVVAEQTSTETVSRAREFVHGIDKTPVEVADAPGFASSRLGVSLGVEAMRMVQEGVATPGDIDTAMELGYNHPMGPIELGDVVGLDVRLDILEYLRAELGERFRPPQILKRKVRAGKLGRKSGEGFYVWEDGDIVGTSGDWGDA